MSGSFSLREHRVRANGLGHHLIEWVPTGEVVHCTPVVLCHGFLDMAWSWSGVAERLCAQGWRVWALDWRGHGQTDWCADHTRYHFTDYIFDLDGILPQISKEAVHLVGHSMGGVASSMYASVRSEMVETLTLVEGFGPPFLGPLDAPRQLRGALDSHLAQRGRALRPIQGLQEAIRRMRVQHPELQGELAEFLASHSTKAHSGSADPGSADPGSGDPGSADSGRADGETLLQWRFDPKHRTISPTPFIEGVFEGFLRHVDRPTLSIVGERGYRPADEDKRISWLGDVRMETLPDVGHMIHWFRPEDLAKRLHRFFSEVDPPHSREAR